ncbi:FtsX-like permease family protein [Clostridium sp. JN-9]|uniref:ABC transporter permease n=1 Tax=Clostridium sp. JN-9 TaxID=2507159 RepID=UPI000FFE1A85|nr:FtsX-like permease family protein [Clostridium sp. JN-9]QAT39730.1 FtsX-like permease family protein [Clostridium sp. JN-9]
MKSFWGLIPRNLIKNKKKNAFIAIGIVLSMCLIISLSIMLDTLKKSSYERTIDNAGGAYDIWVSSTSADNVNLFKKDPIFTKISICENLGLYQVPDSNYTLEINGYDKNIPDFINMKLQQGRYPENDNEIAVQDWILDKLPQKYKIGDKVNLTSTLSYKNSKGDNEEFKVENQLILVGIYKSNNISGGKNKATAYVTKKYVESKIPPLLIKYGGYFMVNPKYSIGKSIEILRSTNEYIKVPFSENSLKAYLLQAFKGIDYVSIVLYTIIGVVAAVIIYNIFNISVTERIKEFGMLRAIGSSPGQIKMLILGEGLILGCIFIPIGIILGNFIVKGVISLTSGYKNFSGIMNIPKLGITASIIVGFLSIIMGTYSSARRASKISPIEAISSNSNLKLTGRNIKKQLQRKSFMGKLFGFTADMAYLNLNRNRKRFVTTVVSHKYSNVFYCKLFN